MLNPQRYGSKAARRALALLALLALLAGAGRAHAVQIVVTTTQDETTNDGDCSLREAFQAANLNQARDACAAGSNTSSDEIVLTSDAVYSLTIAGNDNQGLLGPLVVKNNTATTDVRVTVAGTGTATISQDAVPDSRIFVTTVGAKLDLEDVALQGGTAGVSESGGAIFVNNDVTVSLLRCVLSDNVAGDRGGAIVNVKGTVVVEDSLFEFNQAGSSGGAIAAGSDSVTLIKNTLFVGNVALGKFSGGGALDSNSVLSVVGSTFLDNRAKQIGGAITHFHDVANESSIVTSCFVGNESDFSHDAVFVAAGSQPLNAAGNWWGAADGPSGAASGHGDAVTSLVNVTPPSNVPLPECLPLELVANGGFQSDGDGDGIPQRFTPASLAAADRRTCSDSGACVFKMRGNGAVKQLSQLIRLAGHAGDTFTFKARSRAQDVPAGKGSYRAQVTIFHSDGSRQTSSLDFSTGKHPFERLNKEVVAAEDYVNIQVRIEYGKSSGVVRFDSLSLVLGE